MELNGLLEHARPGPERIALQDHERSITYAQLAQEVDEERRWLETSGERFALLAENGCSWAVADLALQEAKRLNVPLPPYFTAQQLRHVVADAGIDSILTDQPRRIPELFPHFTHADESRRTGLTLFRHMSSYQAQRFPLPAGVAKITYTSGSTADPKGVCLSASAVEHVARSLHTATLPLKITRHLCLMPLPTLLENVAGVYAPLLAGATCILPPASITGMQYGGIDPRKLLGTIATTQPESLILVPELLRLLVQAASQGWPVPRSLKFIAVGGAPVSTELLAEAAGLGLPVFQGYGLSECASVVCLNTPDANRPGSVGRPLPHAQVRVDERGQLWVRGAVMNGYLDAQSRPGLEELATGDLGEIDADGFVYIKGRMRNVFITSLGRNISPEWIERELTREAHIGHALAMGEARPFAVALVSKAREDVDTSAIQRAVARANTRLPDYARIARWALLPDVPTLENGLLTPNGRLRREQILDRYSRLVAELYDHSPAERIA